MNWLEGLINYDFFTWVNITIVMFSSLLLYITISHYKFYRKSQKSELAERIRDVFFADFMSTLSVLSFNGTVFLSSGYEVYSQHEWIRIALKVFQLFTIIYNLRASWRLHSYYKKLG